MKKPYDSGAHLKSFDTVRHHMNFGGKEKPQLSFKLGAFSVSLDRTGTLMLGFNIPRLLKMKR